MKLTRKFVFLPGLLLLIVTQGCDKKKAHVPPKMQAPTVAVILPDEIPLAEQPEDTAPPPEEPKPQAQPTKSKPKKPARSSSASAKKPSPPPQAPAPAQGQQSAPTQTVASVRPPTPKGSENLPETVIAAAVPNAQVAQLKEDTAKMIESTENTLKGINRNLSDDEKSMRSQIQSYLQQSRKATTDGDYERASLLAKKAQLLVEALVKK